MSTKTIEDLRERLFDVMDGIKAGTVSLDQAQTMLSVGQVIVNTAKVEVDFLRATERYDSAFLAAGASRQLADGSGIASIRRHLLKDE